MADRIEDLTAEWRKKHMAQKTEAEERLIQAALRLEENEVVYFAPMRQAVADVREERKPKPRFYTGASFVGSQVFERIGTISTCIVSGVTLGTAQRIVDALNEYHERRNPGASA